jgi:CubicO group peptidase (beta-lactamase class C family)
MPVLMKKLFSSVVLVLLITACGGGGGGGGSAPVAVEETGVDRIDSAMRDIMSRYAPPGIAVTVVRSGKLVFAEAYGSADLAGTDPLRPDHLFRVASVSKPITGIAALRAVEEGLLDVDARVFDILASFLPADGADPRIGDITVWHLMHHTGGWDLWGYPDDPLFRSKEIAEDLGAPMPLTPQDLTRWLAKQPLAFAPGSDFNYTNIGFIALGRVIEQSTGFLYEDFVRRFVLGPAGIATARLGGATRDEKLPGEVEYESFRDRIWKSVFDGVTVVDEPAYGGINLLGFDASSAWVISAVDMARLAAATDGDPDYPDILTRDSFRDMTRVGTPEGTTPLGVAWFLGTNAIGNTLEWNHSGGMPGTSSLLARLPSGVIVALVTNTARDGNFFSDLSGGLIDAVNGITDWPETDLFARYQ